MSNSPDSSRGFHGSVVVPATLVELLRSRADGFPDRRVFTFLDFAEEESAYLTYARLDGNAKAIGAQLQDAGLAGERALLLYPAGLDFISSFFGCMYAGVVAVPAPAPGMSHLQRTISRLEAMALDAGVEFGLTTSDMLPVVKAAGERSDVLRRIRWLATDAVESGMSEKWKEPTSDGRALAYLQYTSGSTMIPKGAMVSHRNVLHNSDYISRAWGYTPSSISVVWVPYYHDDGLVHGLVQPVYRGGEAFLMSPQSFIQKPVRWLQAITKHGATHAGGPNFAYEFCIRKVSEQEREGLDLSTWRMAYNAAEPVRHQTLRRFAETFASCGFRSTSFYPSYGLAEATLLVTTKRRAKSEPITCTLSVEALERENTAVEAQPGEPRTRTLVGCGSAVGEMKVVIAHPQRLTLCASGEVGEILISDAGVVRGYWRNPEETARTFEVFLADRGEGPFLRTGDLGFLRDGELFVTGRIKDLVIVRGQNHYPQDIEWTVEQSHALVRRGCSAVFSLDFNSEERVVLVAEVDADGRTSRYEPFSQPPHNSSADLSSDAVDVISAARLAVAENHELQLYCVLLLKPGSIPKTSSGKIQRSACRDLFLAGSFDVFAAWTQEIEAAPVSTRAATADPAAAHSAADIQAWLIDELVRDAANLLGRRGLPPNVNTALSRLGLDSIAAVELKNRVETHWGVNLPLVKLLQDTTVAQLAAWVFENACAAPAALPAAALHAAPLPPSLKADELLTPLDSGVGQQHEMENLLSNLDGLSEAQLDVLLNRLLAEGESQ